MTEEISKTTLTQNKVLDDGTYYQHVTHIQTYISNMDPRVKAMLVGYAVVVCVCYGVYSYSDGKLALNTFRTSDTNKQLYVKYDQNVAFKEFKAIRNGINSWNNFWDACFFPFSLSEKVMPWIIMKLNPPPPYLGVTLAG